MSIFILSGVVGWCDGPGSASSAGASYNLEDSRARAYCTCSRWGGVCVDIFALLYLFSPLSPSLWEMAQYRLKYCLKGPLNLVMRLLTLRSAPLHQRHETAFLKKM